MGIETVVGIVIGLFGIGLSIYMHKSSDQKLSDQSKNLDQLRRDKTELERVNKDLVNAHNLLQEKLPIQQTHTVLLDGMSGAGKTTLATRLTNPIATQEELLANLATKKEYMTSEMPLCWEKNTRKTILNTIRFYDVAGEWGSTVINALHHLFEEKRSKKGVILVIVWDLSKSKEENEKYLSGYRLEATYGNKLAKSLIKTIVVFFNKADKADVAQRDRLIREYSSEIDRVFRQHFEVGYGEIVFCSGSALQGTGLFDCYAEVLRRLDLAGNYTDSLGSAA